MADQKDDPNQSLDLQIEPSDSESEDESDSDSDSDSDSSDDDDSPSTTSTKRSAPASAYFDEDDNSPETNLRRFSAVLDSRTVRRRRNRIDYAPEPEDLFNFPKDPENWREEDIRELWADGPIYTDKPGWDPALADEDDWDAIELEREAGLNPPTPPFYVPYRKCYPVIPDNHPDIASPKAVIEELDRIEEFLKWGSYIFKDRSTYEGTVWDDLAHGKGVYVGERGMVRYEGEWLRNQMEGHGVVEVEIPDAEPVPGSKLEAKMRKEGRIIKRDFMTPEDRKWLEMDIQDSVRLAGRRREIPFYERKEWIDVFGHKPEKGRYRYAGQWKHGRMHGCGVYEVNQRFIYGRFYFGEHLDDTTGCDEDVSALHAGIAEVAAAKARMFVNKPDGMVREERGPYGDPQHPYFYEEDDVWMAPGFVNQFYEVPDFWKTYVEEVDKEREMWLNSFYKAPLRIPMPAELEYWWSQVEGPDSPEFVLINKEPEPDPEDPTKLIYTEDPIIVHTPTGRLINYVEDEEHGVRLFWQPQLEEGEDVDPDKAEFLPLGYDEFFGKAEEGVKKENKLMSIITSLENKLNPLFERLEKWIEEKIKASEMNQKLIEEELEFIEAEICLEEELEDLDDALKMKQKEEEKQEENQSVTQKESNQVSGEAGEDEADSEDEDENEGEDEGASPSSFGTVIQEETDKSEGKSSKSPFSSLSMSLGSCTPILMIPSNLQESFTSWKKGRTLPTNLFPCMKVEKEPVDQHEQSVGSVNFPFSCSPGRQHAMRAVVPQRRHGHRKSSCGYNQLNSLAQILSSQEAHKNKATRLTNERCSGVSDLCNLSIWSLSVPITEIFAHS